MTADQPGIRRIDSTTRYGKPTHWYEIDGHKADGVTTLISDGLPKPALIHWAGKATAEYAVNNWSTLTEKPISERLKVLNGARYAERDAAARRGTEVHGLAEKLIHGEEVDVPDELVGHVESTVRFLDEWKLAPVLVESTVASRRYNYCGTLDVVGDLPDGRRGIWDYKTSRSGLYPDTALQLAAYAHAEVYLDAGEEKPLPDVGITHAFGVWVRADGYDVYELDISERVYKDFLHICWVARTTKRMATWKSDALPTPAGVAS